MTESTEEQTLVERVEGPCDEMLDGRYRTESRDRGRAQVR